MLRLELRSATVTFTRSSLSVMSAWIAEVRTHEALPLTEELLLATNGAGEEEVTFLQGCDHTHIYNLNWTS